MCELGGLFIFRWRWAESTVKDFEGMSGVSVGVDIICDGGGVIIGGVGVDDGFDKGERVIAS